MHLQCRQQSDDGSRVFACHLGQHAMLGYAAIRMGIQTATNVGEQALSNQPCEGNTGQPQRIEIAQAYEAALGGEFQNGLMGSFHAFMLLHYVGSCEYLPRKHNKSGFLCYPMLQSKRLIRPRVTH